MVTTPYCELGLVERGFRLALSWQDRYSLAETLGEIASLLPLDLVREAVTRTKGFRFQGNREAALPALLARLAELGYPQEGLEAAKAEETEEVRLAALKKLAPYLSEDLVRETLDLCRSRAGDDGAPYGREEALGAIAVRFAELGDVQQGIAITERMSPFRYQDGKAVAGIAPYLNEDQLQTALRIASKMWSKDEALSSLAPRLAARGPDQAEETLRLAMALRDTRERTRVLASLAPPLMALPDGECDQILREAFHLAAARSRKEMLADLGAFLPLLAKIGGREAFEEISNALTEVAARWP